MTLTQARKRQLNIDLIVIAVIALLNLAAYMVFNRQINQIVWDRSIHIVLRVLFVGGLFQYGLAGFGITVVSLYRRENLFGHGLTRKNVWQALLLSALCCLPDFIYNYATGQMHAWCPFWDVNTTAEVLASGFPSNVLGLLITGICWGFFEGYNYVVIGDKLNERFPSKHQWLDWGAVVCTVMCLVVHGVLGITPDALIDMLCTIILIYGMLLVRRKTGNAWGCVMIFVLYWNAL